MSTVLIIAEHDGNELNASTAKTVSCAQAIGGDVDILLLGEGIASVADAAGALTGVRSVITVEAPHLAKPLAAQWAPEITAVSENYSHVIGPSSTFGRDLMPRVAALLGVNGVSDIMSVEGPRRFRRPVYAGNAIVTVSVPDGQKVVGTARLASWGEAGNDGAATVESTQVKSADAGHTRWVGLESGDGERPDLQTAKVVVSGGRALGSAENFDLLYQLADVLGAGVGASRAAVDAGYVPNDMQVGQTGKIIAPELYMAFGISGAIQHVTGIKDAGTIVAVNKDPDAPIFELADIGLAGDLFTIIPELIERLG
ncbi:MAG: FAD-binding protein [Xanthomonadales bacterium]|nr:FAD-binding protein [Xanthomonadales bacterium]